MFLRFFREWVLCPNINGSFSPSPNAYAYAYKISFASTAFCVKGPWGNTDFNQICGTDIILFSFGDCLRGTILFSNTVPHSLHIMDSSPVSVTVDSFVTAICVSLCGHSYVE